MAYSPAASEDSESSDEAAAEVNRQKVASWRQQNGLHEDSDFAYWFVNHADALAAGGAVARAWAKARRNEETMLEHEVGPAY